MRILLLTGTFPPWHCGVGDYVARLVDALAGTPGTEVGVLTYAGAHAARNAPVDVLAVAQGWRVRDLPVLLRTIRAWRPDIVHIHYPSLGFGGRILPSLLPLLCKLLGLKVVQTWHEPWELVTAPRAVVQRLGADGLIFVRPNYRELLLPILRPLLWACERRTIGSAGALPASRLSDAELKLVRTRYLQGREKLVVFFGFVYPAKGVEQLFDIADPLRHAVVIAGPAPDFVYLERLNSLAVERGWGSQVQYTGHLQEVQAADLLRAADAVVLPFLNGGGDWNTSIHAALAQGTLVITTAEHPRGYDVDRNLYTAQVSDIDDMKRALNALAGRRAAVLPTDAWAEIARAHVEFYVRCTRAK